MKRYYLISMVVILIGSLVAAPAAQADLVSLTLILSGVFFTGVAVNETVFDDEEDNELTQSSTTYQNP